MKRKLLLVSLCGLVLCGCSTVEQKGTVTIQGRGAKLLTAKGDRLMNTGVYAKKDVPAEFAEGYAKGISDEVKREYWSMQDEQANPVRSSSSGTGAAEGKTNYYNLTIPAHVDPDGVNHAQQQVSVPMVE
jgi:hypothetical protein